jgi:transposase
MITLILEGVKITDISKKLKVTKSTIYSWLKRDDVKRNNKIVEYK